jgi:hypothetical protein
MPALVTNDLREAQIASVRKFVHLGLLRSDEDRRKPELASSLKIAGWLIKIPPPSCKKTQVGVTEATRP